MCVATQGHGFAQLHHGVVGNPARESHHARQRKETDRVRATKVAGSGSAKGFDESIQKYRRHLGLIDAQQVCGQFWRVARSYCGCNALKRTILYAPCSGPWFDVAIGRGENDE